MTGGTLGFDNTAGLAQGTNFSGGVISGSGSLLVSAGQVTMTNAANSFTGNIVINGGTLNANATGTAGGASVLGTFSNNSRTITVNSGGMLYYSAKDIQGGESTTDGPVIIVNGGTFYNNSIHNYLATPLTLNSGTLTATDGDSWGNPSLGFNLATTVFNLSGTSVINGTGTWPGLSLATATTFDFTAPGSLTVSVPLWNRPGGTTSASLIEAGPGLLVLTASNQYNGTTTISSGSTLQLGNGGSLNPGSAITDNGTFVLNNAGTLVQGTSFSTAAITGGGNLVVSAGSATLTALNTYSGGTIVNGGTLALATGGTAGAIIDTLTVNPGGTVNLTAVNALGYSGGHVTTVSISGGVMLNSGGNEGLDTNFNLTGGTMSSTGGGYQFNMSGASIATNGSTASSVISGAIGIQGNSLTFNVSPGTVATGIDLLVSGVISGGAGDPVTKTGKGLMELTGANTFTGNVVVSAGTLEANHDAGGSSAATALGNLTAGQTITVNGGAVLQFASQNVMGEGTLVPPTAQLNIAQGGLLTATVAAQANMIGPLGLSGGTLYGAGAGSNFNIGIGAAETVTVSGSATSYIAGSSTFAGIQLAASNTFNVTGSGGLIVSTPLQNSILTNAAAAVIKTGSGLMVLAATNTYTGGTTVNAGILQLGGAVATLGSGTAALAVNGGVVDLHGFNATVGPLNGTGGAIDDLTTTSSTLTVGNGGGAPSTLGPGAYAGTIQNSSGGTVSLAKIGSGTQILSGTNTYGGTTNVSGGILQFATTSALYAGNQTSWTPMNITAGSQATLAVSVGGTGFTISQAGTLLTNLTGTNSGLLAGSAFGIDTTNATAPVVFSTQLQDSAAGSVGLTKLGAGTLQVTNASNSYTGPTTVVNGQLMLLGANTDPTAPGLVTVSNSTSGGLSILSLLKPNVLGSGGAVSALAPISLNSTNGGTVILEVGAQLDPTGANSLSYMVVPAVPAGTIPTAGQISLGTSGNTQNVVGLSASSANYSQRTVGLYTFDQLDHPADLAVRHLYPRQAGAGLPNGQWDADPRESDRPVFRLGRHERAAFGDSRHGFANA